MKAILSINLILSQLPKDIEVSWDPYDLLSPVLQEALKLNAWCDFLQNWRGFYTMVVAT